MTKIASLRSSMVALSLCVALPALSNDKAPRADNTGKNADSAPTADQSKSNKSDVSLTADIRRAVVKDDTLSTSAHNVKIIVQAGKVTLRGPVKTAEEKTRVAQKASEIAGATNVNNQLEVAP